MRRAYGFPDTTASDKLLRQCGPIKELYIDRGYLGDEHINQRRLSGARVYCKPFPLRNRGRFTKADFAIDLTDGTIRCPNGVTVKAKVGSVSKFPTDKCSSCPNREQCTRAATDRGRCISLHVNEDYLVQLRLQARSDAGRANLRQRTAVEHGLATLHNRQGERAHYRGLRKNLFDLRRHAALTNLSVIDRLRAAA